MDRGLMLDQRTNIVTLTTFARAEHERGPSSAMEGPLTIGILHECERLSQTNTTRVSQKLTFTSIASLSCSSMGAGSEIVAIEEGGRRRRRGGGGHGRQHSSLTLLRVPFNCAQVGSGAQSTCRPDYGIATA